MDAFIVKHPNSVVNTLCNFFGGDTIAYIIWTISFTR
nr:MAG TPA: hypothetical protein [Caudoviricetes sp.]